MITAMKERGTALVMALIILVAVSVIGVAAMKTSTQASRVAVGVQLDAMVFEAAESAIVEAMTHVFMVNMADNSQVFDEIAGLFSYEVLVYCMLRSGGRADSECGDDDVMDARGVLRSEARVGVVGASAVSGFQISISGGGGARVADYELAFQGNGFMPDYGLSNRHVQYAIRRGMYAGKNIE